MSQKKLLFLMPHASTGGQPKVVLKMIERFKDKFDISVIEKNFYGKDFTVQRDQIEQLADFYPLYGRDEKLMPTIKRIDPDIVHCHEIPESFLDSRVVRQLYSDDRKYTLIVTTHSSFSRRKDFTYIPDKIIAVNNQQAKLFEREFDGETQIGTWEYPIELKTITNEQKQEARRYLGLDRGIHCITVGLFNKNKNQGEVFEIAKQLPGVTFHFIGNQAGNFADYWEPLMRNKPENCKIWGERADMEQFYMAADFHLFPSLLELWPISVRESLSYRLPTLLRRLESYGNEYDFTENIIYIDNNIQHTIQTIDELIQRIRN